MRSQSWPDEKYRAYCQKSDYLRDLYPSKKLEVYCRFEQLFNYCLNAGIGMETPSTVGQYIPNEMVSSQLAQKVCYSLAAAEVCDDYPSDQQDQNLLYRFLEELSNVGFNTTGEPISVIENLETSELKHKKNYLKTFWVWSKTVDTLPVVGSPPNPLKKEGFQKPPFLRGIPCNYARSHPIFLRNRAMAPATSFTSLSLW